MGDRSYIASSSGFSQSGAGNNNTTAADEENGAFGVNNYEAKQKVVADYYENNVTMDNFDDLGGTLRKAFREDLPAAAKGTLNAVIKGVTPGFIQRFQNRKIHVLEVEEREQKLDDLGFVVNKTIKDELIYKKEQHRRNKEIKDMIAARKHLRDEVREIINEANAQTVENEFKAFHERREQQLEEYREKISLAKLQQKEKDDREAEVNRRWRINFYGKHAAEQHAELAKADPVQARQARNQAQLNRTFDEWETREANRTRVQVEIPPYPPPVGLPGMELGIFGLPQAEVDRKRLMENKGKIEKDDDEEEYFEDDGTADYAPQEDWYLEEVDQHENHVFDSAPYPEYEQLNDQKMSLESDLLRNQELYEAIQLSVTNFQQALEKMADMKDKLELDQRQVNEEILQIQRAQLGPPRRLAIPAEIPATDAWKQQHAKLFKKVHELQYAMDLAQAKKAAAEAQMIPLAKSIAVQQEKLRAAGRTMHDVNGDLGLLPMIIGKNISKVAGMNPTAKPLETFQAITHKSRLVTMRHESEMATKLHKDANSIEQEMWITRIDEASKKADLERIISRITDISGRLQRSNVDTFRKNIIDSLRGFLASGLKLNPVYSKLVGMLPWFKHHSPGLSKDVIRYVAKTAMGGISFELSDEADNSEALASGVTLGEATSGYCTGVMKLPKDCLWNLVLTISRQGNGEEFDSAHGTDFVTVQIGATITSMMPVGTYFNRVNPNTGTVLYDVKHLYRGKSFAYRFDFSSRVADPKKHLAVSTGLYEEFELKDLEVISDPKVAGRSRVLSSYVKMIRIDDQSGKSRETRLLEELITAEASQARFWDSDIVSQTMQRYSKEFFLRILRAEILLYQEVCKAKRRREYEDTVRMKSLLSEDAVQKEANLEQSMKKYLMVKRAMQRSKLDDGKDLVGQRLILWDDANHCWRNLTVLEVIITWVENGLVARVTHLVQEYDDAHEPIANPKEINLALFKYFASPMQELDPEAIARSKERKQWDDSIEQIAESCKVQVSSMRQELDEFSRRQEKLFKRSKKRIIEAFDSTAEKRATVAADSAVAKRALRNLFEDVLVDIKKGVVKIKETDKPKEIAKVVARRRFIISWITDRRKEVVDQLDQKELEMREMLDERFDEYDQARRAVLTEARHKREVLQALIRKQLAQRKEVLLRRVKFPPAVFKQVVPQAFFCEHAKTKAWGDNYGTGVKCTVCGKELSELHKEESQVLGYGSGADPSLYEAVKRHRDNEMAFRFKSSEELAIVEQERVRLEKERREMEMSEAYFYDFQDLPVIYDFDRRHAVSIKKDGVFRQGLQWKEDELEFFELSKITREKERLEKEGLPEALLEKFDPLAEIEEPPPTFRAIEEKHRAQYNQLVFSIGRLHNFNKRIHEFKLARFELLTELDVFAQVLNALHKESYHFESQLTDLEKDLDRTSKLLSTFQSMKLLWQQASLIQSQALRDKKKAEMNTVGLWADVKECQDRTTILHDETRTLLRFKLITDSKLDYQQKSVKVRSANLDDLRRKHDAVSLRAESLRYCKPGNLVYTKFGQCYVTAFRQKDDMLLIVLPFGAPPAKLYMHYKQVVDFERAKQHAERLLMDVEDAATARFVSTERILIKKELYGMRREEEGMRRYYEFVDLGKNEDKTMRDNVDAAVAESFEITEAKKYRKLQKPNVKKALEHMIKDRKAHRKGYIGPPSGRPKLMSSWEIYKQRKIIEAELKQKFIYEAATKEHTATSLALFRVRSKWVQTYSFELLINTVISEMILEVATEAHSEGRIAKGFAEKKSGIMFPDPAWMQYGTYSSLSTMWREKKDQLKLHIELGRAEAAKNLLLDPRKDQVKLSMDLKEVKKRRIVRLQRLAERARQDALCAEMQREEVRCRDFYRAELLANLRERRYMREEDRASLNMRIAEEKARRAEEEALELMQSAALTAGSGSGGGQGMGGGGNGNGHGGPAPKLSAAQAAELAAKKEFTYERRRQELKDLTLERRRRTEDQALMIIEDETSKALREIDRVERQKAAFMAEFGDPDLEEDDDPNATDEEKRAKNEEAKMEDLGYLERMVSGKKQLPVPVYVRPPPEFESWTVQKRNAFLKVHILVHSKRKRINKKIERDQKLWVKLENKSFEEWQGKFSIASLEEMEGELALMEAEEELKDCESRLIDIKDNMMRVLVYCRDKGEEELKARTDLKRREQLARQKDQELAEADAWLQLCMRRAKNRDKLKRKVFNQCKWVDTESINGFHQRFATELLRERLYLTYFRQIVDSIVNRSEIIATERKLLGLQENLSINKAHLLTKKKAMKGLLGDIRREEYMRMKRSVLNEKLFGASRKACLAARFGGWVRYFWWCRGNKDAFKLKYEIIKQQLLIDRQFKEQLRTQAEQEKHAAEQAANLGKPRGGGNLLARTLMQKHRERTVQCKKCLSYYLESQNNSTLCQYHPKQYIMECPSTCPSPGLTVLCAAHRKMRWTCCDATKHDAGGCARRYHCPPDVDPLYDKVMAKINERDEAIVGSLDELVTEARKHDWTGKKNQAKSKMVFQIEDQIKKDRATADRFKDLKFV